MNPLRFYSLAFAFAVVLAGLASNASAQFSTLTINGCATLTLVSGTTFTCNPTNPNPAPPPDPGAPGGCTATVSPGSLPQLGGLLTLGVTGCTGTNATTTYTWSKSQGTFSGASNAASISDTPVANSLATAITITYSVRVCNGNLCNTFLAAPAVQQAGTGIVPTAINCNGGNTTFGFTATRTFNFDWGPVGAGAGKAFTSDFGHFGPHEALVLTFTTPAILGTNNATGSIGWTPTITAAGSESQLRNIATLSETACDFSFNPLGMGSTRGGVNSSVTWSLGPNTQNYPALLRPNTTYYINMRHYEECPDAHCDLQIEFAKPSGF